MNNDKKTKRPRSRRTISLVLASILAAPAGAWGSGLLSFVEHQRDNPVRRPFEIVLSADGRNVYAIGESAIAVLGRDVATGTTTFLEAHLEGLDGITGIRLASSMALSADGRFAYVASPKHPDAEGVDRGAVAIFERDGDDGTLSLSGVHTDGFSGQSFSRAAAHAVLSPAGDHLYVVSSPDQAVLTFERDPTDGTLRFLDAARHGLTGVTEAVFAAFDAEGRHLYMTSLERGSVTVFRRNQVTGILRLVEDLMSEDPDLDRVFPVFPVSLAVTPDGSYVYVANASSFPFDSGIGEIVSFQRDRSTGALELLQVEHCQVTPDRMTMSTDGRFLYVTAWGDFYEGPSGVVAYRRESSSSALEYVDRAGEDPFFQFHETKTRAVAISPDGRHLYAGSFERRPVVAFERGDDDGHLTRIDEAAGGARLGGAERAAVSPDGRHLYVANPESDSLAVFKRRRDGTLTFVEALTEISDTKTVAVSPDGRWVYAFDGVFSRAPGNGRLSRIDQPFLELAAIDMAVSRDNRHLYVGSEYSFEPVRVFAQDPGSGRLGEVEIAIEAVPGFGRLRSGRAVAVSPDGAYVYAAGHFELSPRGPRVDALWAFARDRATGEIALQAFDTLGPRDFNAAPPRLAVSPDGRHVLMVRPLDNALYVYEHRRRGARLVLVEKHEDGVLGIEGLREPRDVVMTPSGHLLYVAGRHSDAVALFSRDPESGRLAFLETIGEDSPGVDGLFRVEALAASPENRHLYAVSSRLSGITALTLDCVDAEDVLCAAGDRFRVDVEWRTRSGATGTGRKAPPQSESSGLFWFFDADNWEMLVKVLDGCRSNGHYWVFAAATTDVEYTLRVTDTSTGEQRHYFNPLGTASDAITDTQAFGGCEG